MDEIASIENKIEEYFNIYHHDAIAQRQAGEFAYFVKTKSAIGWGCVPFEIDGYKVAYVMVSPDANSDKSSIFYDFIEGSND